MALLAIILLSVIACAATAGDLPCPEVCTLQYDPVCATDGVVFKTFGNLCLLNLANCYQGGHFTLVSAGECPH
ncbi:unnamed protein product [Hermetia illucens]|uniref:Kazal-like domain-containing protein n=1 Tax=Hermetia illucens TaxID=343691 RepID=A0A7R8UJU8_HERIL|nr:PI-actitoxin-Avd5a-like [Hermetia illucens]CAD7081322.1 unnamed protein product [Hermetia illucens]